MRLAGHGKKVLSLAIAAAMAVSVCTTGWAESADSAASTSTSGTQQEEVLDDDQQQNKESVANEGDVNSSALKDEEEQKVSSDSESGAGTTESKEEDTSAASEAGSSDSKKQQNNESVENQPSDASLGIAPVIETGDEETSQTTGAFTVGENSYGSLADAVKNANDGETIMVAPGTYDIGTVSIQKAVNLQGNAAVGQAAPVLKGTVMYGNSAATNVTGQTITVQGITFESTNQMGL